MLSYILPTVKKPRERKQTSLDVLLRTWIDEIRLCFHQLGAAATDVHRAVHLTAAQRGVLESLVPHGEQTVPQLARMRPVSRQHIQGIVDSLAESGLVAPVPNPVHKRSSLIRLTSKGRKVMEAVGSGSAPCCRS